MKSLFLLLFIFISTLQSSAQLQASFNADKTSGCATPGLIVSFTNTSTGASSAATYSWDFGNGNTSQLMNAQASYRTALTYTVTLTVKDGSNTSSASKTITVHQNPIADFSATPVKGCIPLLVNFTSTATPSEGSIDRYVWDFGDGHTNSGSGLGSVTNNYTVAQKSTVGLTVTNSFGCQSTAEVKPDLIESVVGVTPQFTANKTILCSPSEAVTFTNTSTGSGTLGYVWDFGDGSSTLTDKNPVNTYANKGTYTVKLTVTSSDGCSNTLTKTGYINIANFSSTIAVSPTLVCTNTSVSLQGTASPTLANATDATWYFSDNNYGLYTYGLSVYSKAFNTAGTYTARLINTFGACKDTVEKIITVNQAPNLNGFLVVNNALCGAPITVNFKDTTTDAVSWAWDFGTFNSTSTQQAPSYTYNTDGGYYASLVVQNAAGCSARVNKYLSIQKPNIGISYTNSTSPNGLYGCEGMAITFKATPPNTITNYLWDFGDGSATSTDSFPQHTFPLAGHYIIKLTYTTVNGCTGTVTTSSYYNQNVNVYKKPVANFIADQTNICGNTPVIFTNTSTPDNTYGFYTFGDGNSSTYYGNQTIVPYQYYKDGTFTVTMVARNGDTYGYCYDTIVKQNYITVFPPFPKIASAVNTCNGTRGDVAFTQSTRLATQWQWDFGDATTPVVLNTNQTNLTHTYTKNGTYKVVHTAVNGNCSVRDSVTVYVLLKQQPLLTLDKTEVCGSGSVNATISNLDANPTNSYSYYLSSILYGDGSTFNGTVSPYYYYSSFIPPLNISLTGMANGKQDMRMITRSSYFNCADTTNFATIKIKGPEAGFKISGSGCFKKPVIFTDTSTIRNGTAIKTWLWDFGDNTTATITSVKGDTQHIYSNPGTYYTNLKVTDADGCTSSTSTNYSSHQAQAYGPKADFYWSPTPVLPNSTATFYNNSNTFGSAVNTFAWRFSSNNATSNSSFSVNQSYTNALVDTVRLIARSSVYTCVDTIIKLVPVTNINLAFTFISNYINNNNCPPVIVNFNSKTSNVTSIKWLFGDGSSAGNNPTPSHTYNKPGIYKIALIGYGNNGATDTTFDYVTVKGPFASIRTDVKQGCLPVTVTFTADSSSLKNFTWDFGDGNITATTDTFIVHKYISAGAYTPALIMKDAAGCEATFLYATKIISDTLSAAFNNKPLATCQGVPMQFSITKTNTAIGYLNNALQYHWVFGTGNAMDTANVENPAFNYTIAGTYLVSLNVKSVTGCDVTVTDSIRIKPIPKASISGSATICEDVATQYTATTGIAGNISWKWQFNNGNTDGKQTPALQSFKAISSPNTIYVATSLNGCTDTAFYTVVVNKKPTINIAPKTSVVCLGNTVQLSANDGITYQWSPATFLSNPAIANPIATPKTTTTYSVKVTNNNGCINTDSLLVTVGQPFKMSIPKDTFVCQNSSTQLRVSGTNSYLWINNTATLSNTKINNPVATPTTNTLYTVVGYDAYNCFTDTGYTTVLVKPLPTVNAGADVALPVGSTYTFSPTASSDVVGYNWAPATYLNCTNCQTPTSTPRSDIAYQLTVNTIYGCTAKDSVAITLKCVGNTLSMPTAFTPNKDALNDRYYPLGKGIKTITHFAIYNRAGNIIFERNNININDRNAGWDGRYQGIEQPIATYIYIIEAICDTGQVFNEKGTVVLIR